MLRIKLQSLTLKENIPICSSTVSRRSLEEAVAGLFLGRSVFPGSYPDKPNCRPYRLQVEGRGERSPRSARMGLCTSTYGYGFPAIT